MKILALDLGTKTGYCCGFGSFPAVGTWELATTKEIALWGQVRYTRRNDPRCCRLGDRIAQYGPLDAIVFEDVEFIKHRMQGQLWASLRAVVWLYGCVHEGTIIECVPVSTLKLFAAGHGQAGKDRMLASLITKLGLDKTNGLDDNAVDAYWIYLWAKQNLSRIKA